MSNEDMSNRKSTKCPLCRKQYTHAGGYENHIRTAHSDLDIILASGIRHHSSARSDSRYYPEPTPPNGLADSDYESDQSLPEMEPDDFCDSDGEEMSSDASDIRRNETYQEAGFSEIDVAGYNGFIHGLIDNPWSPFSTEHDFKLATWFIQSKVPKSRIDEYFASGLDVTRSASFKSAYTLEKHLKNLDPLGKFLEWTEGIVEDGNHTICFFYRNIIDCVRYLIAQIAYKDSMVYAPVKEYDQVGARLYSEMHTAQWWWEIQVNSTTRSCGRLHVLTKDFEETLPRGATVVPIIGMSDQTHLSNLSGDKKAWRSTSRSAI